MLSFNPMIPSSYVTVEEYSRLTGMAPGTIRDYIQKGRIIIKKKENRRDKPLINMIAMNEIAVREAIEMLG